MEETELARLPQAMQDEARRARAQIMNVMEPVGLIHREVRDIFPIKSKVALDSTKCNAHP